MVYKCDNYFILHKLVFIIRSNEIYDMTYGKNKLVHNERLFSLVGKKITLRKIFSFELFCE
jgi:hypothetical protein